MKTKLKKADMRGQFIDMQPTRGGIPARLVDVCLRRCDIERIGVPYVIGRVKWLRYGRKVTPDDRVFCHYSDKEKAENYSRCMSLIDIWKYRKGAVSQSQVDIFKMCVNRWNFTFPKSAKEVVKEILQHAQVSMGCTP